MKKIYLFVIIAFMGMMINKSSAQSFTSGFESWTSVAPITPTDWFGSKTNFSADSIAKYTTSVHGGTYAIQLKSGTTSHKRLTTQGTPIVAGKTYQISFWVRGHGEIRTGCYKGAGSSGSTYYSYNTYVLVDTLGWKHCTQSITVDTTSAVAQFILSVKSTKADKDHIQVDDVNIDTISSTPTNVTIHDIQYTTASPADSPYANMTVTTSGMVTGKYQYGYFLQDGTGPWNGIYVLDSVNSGSINLGDVVSLKGLVYEYYNLTELKNITNFSVNSTGGTLPTPYDVTSATVKSENVEGVLVKITNADCLDDNAGYGMWTVNTTGILADTCKIHNLLYQYPTPTIGTNYDITGPVYYSYSEYRIEPRDANDVQIHSGISEVNEQSFGIYPNPVSDVINISNIDGIDQLSISNILGETVASYKVNGANTKINASKLQGGVYFISFIKDNNIAGTRKFVKL